MKYLLTLMLGLLVFAPHSQAGDVHLENIPQTPDTDKHYLFYLHGAIIERGNLTPTHPRFGLYDMPAIRSELTSQDTVLISAQRAKGTKITDYAQKTAADVNALIKAGVPASNITVAGFSKGGMITILTSSLLKNNHVNFIFMASCNRWSFDKEDIRVYGRILSLYEASDTIGLSCAPLMAKSPDVTEYKQIMLSTGKKHGAFYLPDPAWVLPLKAWSASAEK